MAEFWQHLGRCSESAPEDTIASQGNGADIQHRFLVKSRPFFLRVDDCQSVVGTKPDLMLSDEHCTNGGFLHRRQQQVEVVQLLAVLPSIERFPFIVGQPSDTFLVFESVKRVGDGSGGIGTDNFDFSAHRHNRLHRFLFFAGLV